MDLRPPYIAVATFLVLIALGVGLWTYLITLFNDQENLSVSSVSSLQKTEVQQEQPLIAISAVGDVMLSRNVEKTMIKETDWLYPFREVAEVLKEADITFANLESAVLKGRMIQTGEMMFRADPKALEGLAFAGVDIVSLANNHTPDFGSSGLKKTFRHLEEQGIEYVGAGVDKSQATKEKCQVVDNRAADLRRLNADTGRYKNLNTKSVQPSTRLDSARQAGSGYTVCFLAFNDSDVVPDSYFATDNHPGTAKMDREVIGELISLAQERSQPDYLIISMHSGNEYQKIPNKRQIEFAHAAIDAGADLVIGHHPHVLQPRELYKGKWILYSLGNFVFDQMFSEQTRLSVIAQIEFYFNTTTIEFMPVKIHHYSQPRVIGDDSRDHQWVMDQLQKRFYSSK